MLFISASALALVQLVAAMAVSTPSVHTRQAAEGEAIHEPSDIHGTNEVGPAIIELVLQSGLTVLDFNEYDPKNPEVSLPPASFSVLPGDLGYKAHRGLQKGNDIAWQVVLWHPTTHVQLITTCTVSMKEPGDQKISVVIPLYLNETQTPKLSYEHIYPEVNEINFVCLEPITRTHGFPTSTASTPQTLTEGSAPTSTAGR